MPSNVVKSFAKKTGKSESEVEEKWEQAKKEAEKMGQGKNFAYITSILKSMLNMKDSTNKRYKSLFLEEPITSSSFPQDIRPEMPYEDEEVYVNGYTDEFEDLSLIGIDEYEDEEYEEYIDDVEEYPEY